MCQDDGNRTIEMYRVESFESGAPAVTNLSIISSNAEHEEQADVAQREGGQRKNELG